MLYYYFFSRVCSTAGDKTVFSYLIDMVMEDRFMIFLKAYHAVYPFSRQEVFIIKEAYRFLYCISHSIGGAFWRSDTHQQSAVIDSDAFSVGGPIVSRGRGRAVAGAGRPAQPAADLALGPRQSHTALGCGYSRWHLRAFGSVVRVANGGGGFGGDVVESRTGGHGATGAFLLSR